MGAHEGWAQPSGLQPNGLLPNAGLVTQVIDSGRWLKAEDRTAELIACIKPSPPSEARRNAVADYVQRLIRRCFPCQVFTFGSVPLKTYLPDGDIDLTAFSNNQNLKDTWANHVRDMLESEEKNENAEFHVKEVQYIHAEVKIIKCLVENIVVDISFNQLGGLCTLCFLEEVDDLINQNHLLKRSIILIKAWCYYESRILGAHHGLISTYALETLVLYIFRVFNNSFTGPLEVLYRFLEFFSNFDWDNFCVSLWGPVPITSLPDVTAEPPRKDSGELLLSKSFIDACSSVYAVFPAGQESQGQHFVSKHFNVIDPLRVNNNLGRSVSKGNFFRIRSAFAFGAKRLAKLLDCPKENLVYEVNQFFMNTWDRHGSGNRPDAPRTDLWSLRLSTPDHLHGPENLKDNPSAKNLNENSSGREVEVDGTRSHNISSPHGKYSLESTSRPTHSSAATRTLSHKTYGNVNSSRIQDPVVQDVGPNSGVHFDKGQRNVGSGHLVNGIQGRFLFARTRSSPELTDTYSNLSSRGMRNETPGSSKTQATSARQDSNRRNNPGSEHLVNHNVRSSTDDLSSVKHMPLDQSLDATVDSNSGLHIYHSDSGSPVVEEFSSVSGSQGMLQEEQDLVNMMASPMVHNHNGRVHMPLNLSSAHPPLPMSPSILASMEYAQTNFAGMIPPNIPLIDPSFSNMQFPHGFVSQPLTHYFPGIRLTPNLDETIEPGHEIFGSTEMNPGETDHDFWQDQDVGSTVGFEPDSGNYEIFHSDDKPQSSSVSLNFVPSSRLSGSGNSTKVRQKFSKENRRSIQEDHPDRFPYQDNRGNDVSFDDRSTSSRFSSAAHSSSLRNKTSSESSWDGSSANVSKSTREKREKKTVHAGPSPVYGKSKNVSEHTTHTKEDERDWNLLSTMTSEKVERSSGPQAVGSLHGLRQHTPGCEIAQTSGSDSMIPMAPVLLGPGSQQRVMDNSGVVPLTFYATGPPVPFLTMLPFYNVPPETGTSDASTSHFGGEEGVDSSESGQNFDSSEGLVPSEELNMPSTSKRADFSETSDEHKSDILNSDFASHWQNLKYGRFCQNPQSHPLIYSSPVVPSGYLQGRVPRDGPGRPLSTNMNLFTQLMGYGPPLVPVAPLQSVPNRPPNVHQRYVDEMPRVRSGTGTYLPNPKVSVRDRHSSGGRRGNYNYDRSDNYGDREGNWNINNKSRASGRNRNRNQSEKSNSRLERLAVSDNRADRSWSSYKHDPISSYQTQNGPLRSDSSQGAPSNVAYGMYPLPVMNPGGASSNEPSAPSVVMLYPFDHNASYSSHAEQLEFGSLGPVGFSGMNEQPQVSKGSQAKEQRFHRASMQRSSPDQPSSPHFQRRV
ncbi:Poly(A) RNA polymerase [Actinidia chinensis var. chinensis]|uniref:Poly(A) RNA polymerase n=1 Tax=Actinidia chinensis var. chinensis TaxID=1590841 RepID=A0A2R6R9K0_ACTCC|nr:Poly(A) RNA polymerase [Actinidia chinensis var. chinensis]